jgi:hypothetical protein
MELERVHKDVLENLMAKLLSSEDLKAIRATSKVMEEKLPEHLVEIQTLKELESILKSNLWSLQSLREGSFREYGNASSFASLSRTVFWYSFNQLVEDYPSYGKDVFALVVENLLWSKCVVPFLKEYPPPEEESDMVKALRERLAFSKEDYQESVLKQWVAEPVVVYLVFCVVDWYLPRLCKILRIEPVSLGCVSVHNPQRGKLSPRALLDRARLMMYAFALQNPKEEFRFALDRVMGSVLVDVHPIHHFPFVVQLISELKKQYETSFVFPNIRCYAEFVVTELGGIFQLQSDNNRVRVIPFDLWMQWKDDADRSSRESSLISSWMERDDEGFTDSYEAICELINYRIE